MGLINRNPKKKSPEEAKAWLDQAKASGQITPEQYDEGLKTGGYYTVNNKKYGIGARAFGKADPFMGRMLGLDEQDRAKLAAQAQFYGGSQENYEGYQDKYGKGVASGGQLANQSLGQAQNVTSFNDSVNAGLRSQFNAYGQAQENVANQAGAGFNRSAQDYGQARNLVLGSANQLQQFAQNAPSQYQKTDAAAFQAQQDSNQKAALSLGASGGYGGMRSALASSTDANMAASQSANINRANQTNQLLGMQQSALTNAGSLYSGVGAQDQGMAGLQANRQAGAYGQQANAIAQQGNLSNASAQIGLQGANMGVGAGLTTQGQYLGAEQGANTAQLASNQAYDALRQQDAKREYDNTWRPMKRIFGG